LVVLFGLLNVITELMRNAFTLLDFILGEQKRHMEESILNQKRFLTGIEENFDLDNRKVTKIINNNHPLVFISFSTCMFSTTRRYPYTEKDNPPFACFIHTNVVVIFVLIRSISKNMNVMCIFIILFCQINENAQCVIFSFFKVKKNNL